MIYNISQKSITKKLQTQFKKQYEVDHKILSENRIHLSNRLLLHLDHSFIPETHVPIQAQSYTTATNHQSDFCRSQKQPSHFFPLANMQIARLARLTRVEFGNSFAIDAGSETRKTAMRLRNPSIHRLSVDLGSSTPKCKPRTLSVNVVTQVRLDLYVLVSGNDQRIANDHFPTIQIRFPLIFPRADRPSDRS